jgi:hypothetical protein
MRILQIRETACNQSVKKTKLNITLTVPPGGRVRGPAGGRAGECPGCAARMRVAASQRSVPRAAGLASVRLQRFLQPSVIKGPRYNEQYGTVEFEPTEKDPVGR